jgi:hypothetical protein
MTVTAGRLLDSIDPCVVFRRNGLTPDPWQTELLRAMPRMSLVCWGRQVGKTTCLAALALHRALYRPGSRVLLASFNHDKAKEMLGKAADLYAPWQTEVPLEAQTTEHLGFRNESRIDAIPARPIAARGPTARLVVLDEAAWTSYELFSTIFPTLMRTGGTLVAVSTPPERATGWWWEAWTKSGEATGGEAVGRLSDLWLRSFVPSTSSPYATPEHIDQARAIMAPEDYAREYECQFPSAQAGALGERAIPRDALDRFFAGMEDEAPEARW